MLDWHLGMVETLDGRPRMLGPADALTLARAWLVPLAWERPTPLRCAVAGLSDAVDGPLARRRGPTRAGRDFDWIVDACFAVAALHGAARHRLLDRWAMRAEATWLSLGVARALHAYFIGLEVPDRSISRSARAFAPVRMAGLFAGAAGRRREGSALLGGGALASLAISGYQLAHRRSG
jgi:phosphatidylglycerophosphate synthase